MPFCPSCGSEFRAGFNECNTCHVPLVASISGSTTDEEDFDDETAVAVDVDLKLLATTTSSSQATIIRRLLDEAGVPSLMHGGHGDDIRTGEPYQILVDEHWLEDARASIEAYNSPGLVTGQIESDLARLEKELAQLEKGEARLKPQLGAVRVSLQRLQKDLEILNGELE